MIVNLLTGSETAFKQGMRDPESDPFEECWQKWEEPTGGIDQAEPPRFNHQCPSCMKELMDSHAQWAVRREEMSLLRSKGIKHVPESGRA